MRRAAWAISWRRVLLIVLGRLMISTARSPGRGSQRTQRTVLSSAVSVGQASNSLVRRGTAPERSGRRSAPLLLFSRRGDRPPGRRPRPRLGSLLSVLEAHLQAQAQGV